MNTATITSKLYPSCMRRVVFLSWFAAGVLSATELTSEKVKMIRETRTAKLILKEHKIAWMIDRETEAHWIVGVGVLTEERFERWETMRVSKRNNIIEKRTDSENGDEKWRVVYSLPNRKR